MTPEKTELLVKKYPRLFQDNFYFECDDGWFEIIDTLSSCINNEIDAVSIKNAHVDTQIDFELFGVSQVKEKFGGLRYYLFGGNDKMYGMIMMAESLSYKTCEVCGDRGYLRKGSWLNTLCDLHSDGREIYSK